MKRFIFFLASLVLLGAIDIVVFAQHMAGPTLSGGQMGGGYNLPPTISFPPMISFPTPYPPQLATQFTRPVVSNSSKPQPSQFPVARSGAKSVPALPVLLRTRISGDVTDYQQEHSMMIGFKHGKEREVRAAVEKLGVTVNTSSPLGFILCTWNNGVDLNRILNAIRQHGETIRYCVPNYKSTLSSEASQDEVKEDKIADTEHLADSQKTLWGLEMIHAQEAWKHSKGESIVVAVIDTGVDYNHPDLAPSMYKHTGTLQSTKEKRDDVVGVNFCADGTEPNTSQVAPNALEHVMNFDPAPLKNSKGEFNAHGTHVAGTIAAAGYSDGVVGVAPRCKVMPLQVFYETPGGNGKIIAQDSATISAIYYAIDHGAKIINLSLSGSTTQEKLQQYLKAGPFNDVLYRAKKEGVLLVLAAGNSSRDVDAKPTFLASLSSHFPDNMIAVAAVDKDGKLAEFSNFGKQAVRIAAPGEDIYSTIPNGKHGNKSGTSMAAPHVAGAAALVWSMVPDMTPKEVIYALIKNGRNDPALLASIGGGKILNLDFVAKGLKRSDTQKKLGDTVDTIRRDDVGDYSGNQRQPESFVTIPYSGYNYNPTMSFSSPACIYCDLPQVGSYPYGYPHCRRPLRRYAVPVCVPNYLCVPSY